jgi:adenosylcobinamide kinase/adenosylcobinamide-phosphate guanylyltransferase
MGLVPVDAASRRFRELAGAVNRLVAQEADESYLVVSGLSIRLK